jgi:cysteine synthase
MGRDVTELVGQTPMVQMNRLVGSRDADELGEGKRVVTIVPDSAERYLSKGVLE